MATDVDAELATDTPDQGAPSPKAKGDRKVTVMSHFVLSLWTIIVVLPLLWVFLSSWKTTSEIFQSPLALPQHWSFDNYIGAWTDSHIGRYMFNSVIVVSVSLVLVMIALALGESARNKSCVVYLAVLDPVTHAVADVQTLWRGTLDQMPVSEDGSSSVISVTALHRAKLFQRVKPLRYTDGDQQKGCPARAGMDRRRV